MCVQHKLDSVEKGACDREFAALKDCFRKAVSIEPLDRMFAENGLSQALDYALEEFRLEVIQFLGW
jgi:hypothetical protein